MRTKAAHITHCDEISSGRADASRDYGVNRDSILNELRYNIHVIVVLYMSAHGTINVIIISATKTSDHAVWVRFRGVIQGMV